MMADCSVYIRSEENKNIVIVARKTEFNYLHRELWRYDEVVCTGLIWLRIGTGGGLF
jgi:hypothetical protein